MSASIVPPAQRWLPAQSETSKSWRKLCPICLDCHAHFLDEHVLNLAEEFSPSTNFGKHRIPHNIPMVQKMFEPDLQIEDMDKRGVDRSILSSAGVMQGLSFASGQQGCDLNRRVNDTCLSWVARHPRRFVGSFILPLDNIDNAMRELDYARSFGLKVANLPTNWDGAYLGDERFEPLWSAFEQHRITCFIHPEGTRDPWFQNYAMWNSIGQSIEEVKVMTSLIYEGTLERHPNLKIVMAHGGGYMPHYMGRLDRNAVEKPETTKNISKKPSEYLSRFYYDSCVLDPTTLQFLVERVGVDRILMGGDYPVAQQDPVAFLESVPSLSAADIAAIAGNNAIKLLNLS